MATNNAADYVPVNHDVIVGAANGGITSVAPSATSGVPFISQGASSDPAFGTAVVAGGGTGVVTMTTAYAPVCAGTTATGALQVASTGLSTSGYVLTSNGASALPSFQASGLSGPGSSTDRAITTWNGTAGTALFNNSTTNIDSTGRQTNSAQPCFVASSANPTNVTGDGTAYTVAYDSTTINRGSYFNTSTFIFTAPVTGVYQFNVLLGYDLSTSLPTSGTLVLLTTTNNYTLQTWKTLVQAQAISSVGAAVAVSMVATDTAKVVLTMSGSTKAVGIEGASGNFRSLFSGYLIC